jgi:hypothetical protein
MSSELKGPGLTRQQLGSPLARTPTTSLRAQRDTVHWDDEPTREPYRSGYPNFSEYRFVPKWHRMTSRRAPFSSKGRRDYPNGAYLVETVRTNPPSGWRTT